MRPRALALGAAAVLALSGAGTAAAAPSPWVVGLERPGHADELAAQLRASGEPAARLARLGAVAVTGERAAVLRAATREGGVAYIEPQLPRHLHAEPAEALDLSTGRPCDWAYEAVHATEGIASAGGGAPNAPVAVVDTGVDSAHPDLAGRLLPGHDVLGAGSVRDLVGHGTFVAGLISAIDGNGIGGRGVAGATPVLPVRVSTGTGITSADLAAGIVAAVDGGARVINVSIGGPRLSIAERDALDYAASHDVLVVASAGNSAEEGNPLEYPAAALGGDAGGWSPGLSVGASGPDGLPAPFSTHNRAVSLVAPGAGAGPCDDGVYSTIPTGPASLWAGGRCDRIFAPPAHGAGRYAYAQGTSFSAPLVAGTAALVRQVRPGMSASQTADALRRSARQTVGQGWNEHTGTGVLDAGAAVVLARQYDLAAPTLSLSAEPASGGVRVRIASDDATGPGDELAGSGSATLETSTDGSAWGPATAVEPAGERILAAPPGQPLWVRTVACDRNHNCATRIVGPVPGGATPSAARRPSVARILGRGARRGCRGAGGCIGVVWRAGASGSGRERYALELRGAGGRVLARTGGEAAGGRRHVIALATRRALACGRIEARLTARLDGRTLRAVRRAPVRRGCRSQP